MVIVLHGENQVQSRQKLVSLTQAARTEHQHVTQLSAQNLTVAELDTSLGTASLFDDERTVVIEGLHSLPIGARRKQLIQLVSAVSSAPAEQPLTVILWERRALTATMLKQFPGAKTQEFKVNNAVFTWLDSLSPSRASLPRQLQLLKAAIEQEDDGLCLAMLNRQVRLLLTSASGGKVAGPPFVQTKVAKQSQQYQLAELLRLHQSLLELDIATKTSQERWPLAVGLEQIVITGAQK